MPVILILEGLTDATFFQEVLARFYLTDFKRLFEETPGRQNVPTGIRGTMAAGNEIEIGFRYSRQDGESIEGGKGRIPDIIKLLLDGDVQSFAVSQDIDHGTPDQIMQSVRDVAKSCLGTDNVGPPSETNQIPLPLGSITVMPMGLLDDDTLSDLGITQHELEDYLIKLLLEDASLRKAAPELGALLTKILPAIREIDGPFNSGKDVYQLIKPIAQIGISDTGAIRRIIRTSNEDILRTVLAPLLENLDSALLSSLQ